jgi:DNA modification methylase
MGSGSTIAACEAIGVESIGVERHREYFDLARAAIPRLRTLETNADEVVGARLRLSSDRKARPLVSPLCPGVAHG